MAGKLLRPQRERAEGALPVRLSCYLLYPGEAETPIPSPAKGREVYCEKNRGLANHGKNRFLKFFSPKAETYPEEAISPSGRVSP